MKSTKYQKRLFKFITPMMLTAVLCVTSPGFAQVPNLTNSNKLTPLTKSQIIAQNQSPLSIEQQAQSHFSKGEFSQAVQLFQESVRKYESSGNTTRQAMSLSNISSAYQKLGQFQEAEKNINLSLKLLQSLPKNIPKNISINRIYAQSLDIKGKLQFAQGQFQNAIVTWENAEKIYTHLDLQSSLIQSRINQAQAMQNLGNYLQARDTLDSVQEILEKQPNSSLKAQGWLRYGNVLQALGDLSQSEEILNKSLEFARSVKDVNIGSNALV